MVVSKHVDNNHIEIHCKNKDEWLINGYLTFQSLENKNEEENEL